MFKLNSKKLIALLFIILGFLGGLGVGRFSTERQSTERTREVEEDSPPLVMYGIGSGETYPEWKKFINKFVKYSIEYPPDSNLSMSSDGSILGISINGGGMDLRALSNEEHLSPREWVDKYYYEAKRGVLREWEHAVSGAEAFSFTTSDPDGERQHSFISRGSKILVVQFSYLPVPEKESDIHAKETLFRMFDTFQLLDR